MTPASSPSSTGLWSRAFVALMLVYLAVAVNGTVSNIALPSIATGIEADTGQLAWIVNSTAMTSAAALLFAGGAADRFGRTRLLYVGIAFFLLAALMSFVVDTPGELIALRALSGVASAFTMPAAMALVFVVIATRARPTAIGLMSSTQAVGSIMGPLLGGLVLMYFAWPAAYLIIVPFLLVAIAMLARSLPRDDGHAVDGDRPPLDLVGATLTAVAGLALIFAVLEGTGGGGWVGVVSGAVGIACIATLLWWERRAEDGLLDLSIVSRRRWFVPAIGVFMVNFVLGGMMFVSTQYTQLVLGFAPLAAGLFLLPALVVWTASAALSGRAVRLIGHRRLLLTSFCTGTAGLVLVALAAVGPNLVVMCLGLALVGVIGAAPAQLTYLTVSAFPQPRRGAGSALNTLTLRFGLAFGVALVAACLDAIYASELAPAVDGLAQPVGERALSGLAGALAVSNGAPGIELIATARDAFVTGYQVVLLGSAVLVLATAILIAFALPRDIDVASGTIPQEAQ